MRNFAGLLILVFSVSGGAFEGNTARRFKKQLGEALRTNDGRGAVLVCALLKRTLGFVAQAQRLDIHALRRWEEVLQDCQSTVARMRSAAAERVFREALARMGPSAQAIIAMGLKAHPPDESVAKTCRKLLRKSRYANVQVACLELLGAQRDKAGLPAVQKFLNTSLPFGVQVAACRALGSIQETRAVEPLIAYLGRLGEGWLRHEAAAALRSLTGQRFGASPKAWARWWAQHPAASAPSLPAPPAHPPPAPEADPGAPEDLSYYGIPVVGKRILFIMDISGSMMRGGTPYRLFTAQKELKELIGRLGKETFFNILLFNTKVYRWRFKQALVPATKANKHAAIGFVYQALPDGGTDTMHALEVALLRIAPAAKLESIFLLTDGGPDPMHHSEIKSLPEFYKGFPDIRRRIRFLNQGLKVRIHTIGIYTRTKKDAKREKISYMKAFLKGVAKDNDGAYKEVE